VHAEARLVWIQFTTLQAGHGYARLSGTPQIQESKYVVSVETIVLLSRVKSPLVT
jgi:hypothetical protein